MSKAVVLGVTADLAFAAGTVVAALAARDPGFDADIVVMHDGLDEAARAAFRRLWPRTRFARFSAETVLSRLGNGASADRLRPVFRRFSPLVLAKLDLPLLLDAYAQVLWLDADLLVRGALTEAWEFDALGWRVLGSGAFGRREADLAAFGDLPRDPEVPLLNAGVVGIGRAFRDRHGLGAADLWAMARLVLARTETVQVDEFALYLLAASRGVAVAELPRTVNCPVTLPGAARAAVVHAVGARKFWNSAALRGAFPDWAAHHAAWVAAGGAPYAGPVAAADRPAPA